MVTPPIGSGQPPRLFELDEYTFQNLCRDLLYDEPNIATSEVFGRRGEPQLGIDLLASRKGGGGLEVGQCKCHEDFPPIKIRDASDEFLQHWEYWSEQNVKRFILMVACDLSHTPRQREILRQKKLFSDLGVEYEAWSSAHIKNKLAPHHELVNEYLGEFWVPIICGGRSSIAQLAPSQESQAIQIISATMMNQLDRLSGVISGQVDQQLNKLRNEWRNGRRTNVLAGLRDIKTDSDIWIAITGETKGQILRLEASLELQISGNVQMATRLADEARILAPNADDSRIRALIALREHGPASALDLVTGDGIDDLNLKAGLNLGTGNVEAAREVLSLKGTDIEPTAETFRLRALVSLLNKDVPEAIRIIQTAKEREPEWVSIKHAGAVIDYFAALSPVALPDQSFSLPPPVPWSLVRRDNEAVNRLRLAANNFKELAADAEGEEQFKSKAWLLACLANDQDRQEDAAEYCRGLLAQDPTYYPAIAWALARRYLVDLEPSLNALEESVGEGSVEIPHIISLAHCYLESDRPVEAVQLLQRTRDVFLELDASLWTVLQIRALAAAGDHEQAILLASNDSEPYARQALSLALHLSAEITGEWTPLVAHLESSYTATNDPLFLLELCDLKSEQKDWDYVSTVGNELIDAVQTAEAVGIVATALFNLQRPRRCLDLLDEHRQLFREGKLTSQLRRMRASCQGALGMLPEAITESEALVNEDPTTNNLLHLAESCAAMADLKRLAVTARKLIGRPDLASESSLSLARLLVEEDKQLAISLWKKSVGNVPDELVGIGIYTGYQLGLDADPDFRQLFARLNRLAAEGKGGVRSMPFEEIVAYARKYRDQTIKLEEAYRSGVAPVHCITASANVPLAEIYYGIPSRNQVSPDPLRNSPVFVRYGGRPAEGPTLRSSQPQRLNMDITAVLLAEYLGILRQVEDLPNQLRIPHSLIPALLEMREKVAPHQPSKLAVFEDITKLVDEHSLGVIDIVLPANKVQDELSEAMEPDWIALLEFARSSDGYLVDYLPLRSIRSNDAAPPIPNDSVETLVNCRAVAESLRQHGPLSQSDLDHALSELGTEGAKGPIMTIPSQGKKLILYSNISETLSSAGLLKIACDRFEVCIGRSDFDRILGGLDSLKAGLALAEWLGNLIDHIGQGIEGGTYEVLPADAIYAIDPKRDKVDSLGLSCLLELTAVEWEEGDVVWVDDRYTTAYTNVGSAPLIDIIGVLKGLFECGSLDKSEYFAAIIRLRAANFRYVPITEAEILYQLSQAEVSNDGLVIETQELEVIRRYFAACLVQSTPLQRPPMDSSAPNQNGEVEFVQGLVRECSRSIVEVWAAGDPNQCAARSEWLLTNLYLDHLGLSKSTPFIKKDLSDSYLAALSLTWLITGGFSLPLFPGPDEVVSRRKNFLEWLDNRLLQPLSAAEPEFIGIVAQLVRTYLSATYEEMPDSAPRGLAMQSLQLFYFDLPVRLQEEMRLDTDFMAKVGMGVSLTIGVDDVRFQLEDFYRIAAGVINGVEAAIKPLDSNKQVLLKRLDLPSGAVGVRFDHPETGQHKTAAGPDIEVLAKSPADIEAALRRHRCLFDCADEQFERVLTEIVTTLAPQRRAELVREWMTKSATVYYSSLFRDLNQMGELTFAKALPPDFEHLVKHFRLPADLEEGKAFQAASNEAVDVLLPEVGAEETFKRLAAFPTAIPFEIVYQIKALPATERRLLVKRLLRSPGSPISRIHLVRLLAELGKDEDSYARLARCLALKLLQTEGIKDTEAFITVLTWVSEQFGNWHKVHDYDPRLRLAMEWAHAHRLFSALTGSGAPIAWINDHFSAWRRSLLTTDALRNQKCWSDIAHPRQITPKRFLIAALSYAVGDYRTVITDQLTRLVAEASFFEAEGQRVQSPDLMLDPTLADNSLGSFLGQDRGKALTPFIGTVLGRSFTRSTCLRTVKEAMVMIESGSGADLGFGLLGAIVGNRRPYRGTNNRLTNLAKTTSYVGILTTAPDYGKIAFQFAAGLVANNKNVILRGHLKTELVAIAKYFASREPIGPVGDAFLLLGWALNLTLTSKPSVNRFAEFGRLTIELTEAWPAFAVAARSTFAKFCAELPLRDASELWPALLRLRAEQ